MLPPRWLISVIPSCAAVFRRRDTVISPCTDFGRFAVPVDQFVQQVHFVLLIPHAGDLPVHIQPLAQALHIAFRNMGIDLNIHGALCRFLYRLALGFRHSFASSRRYMS